MRKTERKVERLGEEETTILIDREDSCGAQFQMNDLICFRQFKGNYESGRVCAFVYGEVVYVARMFFCELEDEEQDGDYVTFVFDNPKYTPMVFTMGAFHKEIQVLGYALDLQRSVE